MGKHPTHWSMFVVGGIAFLLIGEINEYISWDLYIELQMLIGACITTVIEFLSGLILNIYLKLNVWDYSNLPYNFMGQICLPFFFIWFILSLLGILVDDYIRWIFFNEEKPRYTSYLLNKEIM